MTNIHELVTPRTRVVESSRESLRKATERLERGDITAVAIAYIAIDGSTGMLTGEQDDACKMVGAIECMKADLIERMMLSDVEEES